MRAMLDSRMSRSRISAGVTSCSRDPRTPTKLAFGARSSVWSDSDGGRDGFDIGEREAEPATFVFLESFEDFELDRSIACKLRVGFVFDSALLRHAQHPLFHPRDVPLLVFGELVENLARELVAEAARSVFRVARHRTFFDDDRQCEQIDDVRGEPYRLAEATLVAVRHLDGHASELTDALGPEPCVTRLVCDMAREEHLRLRVFFPLRHLHEQRRAAY